MQAANLEIQRTTTPRPKVANEKLTFGTTFTDHMLEIDWEQGEGWKNPLIRCVTVYVVYCALCVCVY